MLKIRNLQLFIFINSFHFAIYGIMANGKKLLKEDEALSELEKWIIQKIENYIDEKLKPILDKIREKKEYCNMSFL